MTTAYRCPRTPDLPLVGADPIAEAIEAHHQRRDEGEHTPHRKPHVQAAIWHERHKRMARRGRGTDAQWLAGALLAAHGEDARAVIRRWVAEHGPRKTWGEADRKLAEMGIPERVQVDLERGAPPGKQDAPAMGPQWKRRRRGS